ncbi:glycine cleavage H-protein-domain-containing protein [Kalaharituber pfeilii]|nr:glycine cleavage H-protein-domain-containing protein [Kalaharituber pfeilii]
MSICRHPQALISHKFQLLTLDLCTTEVRFGLFHHYTTTFRHCRTVLPSLDFYSSPPATEKRTSQVRSDLTHRKSRFASPSFPAPLVTMATTTLLRPLMRSSLRSFARTIPITTTTFRSFSSVPSGVIRKYTQDHEYVHLTPPSRVATIGITKHAASALGDIVYIELLSPSTPITAGGTLGVVESVKSASDILSPLSGTVVKVNQKLADSPGLLNAQTAEDVGEDGGWIYKIEVPEGKEAEAELDGLMREEEYESFKKGEEH